MKKNAIFIILVIIFLIIIIYALYNIFGSFKVKNNNYFKKVYNSNEDISEINMYIYNIKNGKQTLIKNREDVLFIINNIKEIRAKVKKIPSSEILLGGSCRFNIENFNRNTSLKLRLQSSQISIEDRTYKFDSTIWEKISKIVKKYDPDCIG